jgi:recombination protein RecA
MAKAAKDGYLKKIEELNKKFGMGTIIGGTDYHDKVEVVDSGSLTLNIATGLNGLPVGKLIEMFGPESSGKSTLTLHFMTEFQKANKRCALVDFEQSFDKGYAKTLGVNEDELYIIQPECMEDGYNIIEELIKTDGFGLIVLDSHTAMIPRKALEGEIGDAKIALQARINSEALLKIKPLLLPHSCSMIGIAQLRTQIGSYGDPDKPSGGNAWKFYSDVRFKVSKQLKKEDEINKTTVEVIKNKCAPPFGKASFNINWGTGIDRLQEIIDLAVEFEYIQKGGAGWYTLKDDIKMQGDDKLKVFLNDNPGFAEELEEKVLLKIKEAA